MTAWTDLPPGAAVDWEEFSPSSGPGSPWVFKDSGYLNVKDHGVVGGGSVNDTLAAQAVLYLAQSLHKKLYWPADTYSVDRLIATSSNLYMFGDGKGLSIIQKRSSDGQELIQLNSNAPVGYLSGLVFEDIGFKGIPGNTAAAMRLYDVVRSNFTRCAFTSSLIGVDNKGGIGLYYEDCQIDSNVDGIIFDKYVSFSGFPNFNIIKESEITHNSGWGLKFDGGRTLTVSDCDIESNGTTGTPNSGGIFEGSLIGSEGGTVSLGVNALRCWFENNAGGAVVSLGSGRNKFDTCYFVANPNATNDVIVNGGKYTFVDCDNDTNKTVSFNETAGASSPNYIIDCDFVGAVNVDTSKTEIIGDVANATYVPVLGGGFAIGSGTIAGKFKKRGKNYWYEIDITWAADSTFGAGPLTVTAPATRKNGVTGRADLARYRDASAGALYMGMGDFAANSNVITMRSIANATGQVVGVTSTAPFTWATGDNISCSGEFERT